MSVEFFGSEPLMKELFDDRFTVMHMSPPKVNGFIKFGEEDEEDLEKVFPSFTVEEVPDRVSHLDVPCIHEPRIWNEKEVKVDPFELPLSRASSDPIQPAILTKPSSMIYSGK